VPCRGWLKVRAGGLRRCVSLAVQWKSQGGARCWGCCRRDPSGRAAAEGLLARACAAASCMRRRVVPVHYVT
jgi:hypothetical protein